MSDEDGSAFEELQKDLCKEHAPKTMTERILIQRMAQHEWLRARAQRLQMEFLTNLKYFALYLRYETTHERGFSQCLAELRKVRAERRKEQDGFESQTHLRDAGEFRKELHEMKKVRHQQAVALANVRLAKQNRLLEVPKAPEPEPIRLATAA